MCQRTEKQMITCCAKGVHQDNMSVKCIPRIPHLYIVKLGYAGVYLFFVLLLQNIDCGNSLEPPHRDGSNVYPQSMFYVFSKTIR